MEQTRTIEDVVDGLHALRGSLARLILARNERRHTAATAGERIVSGPRITGRAAFVSSIIPSVGNGCEAGGSGFLNAIDIFTGTSPADGGGTGSSSFFDLDGDGDGTNDTIGDDGLPVGSVDPGVGMPTESAQIDDLILVCGSNGQCTTIPASPQAGEIDARRLQWREIIGED